MDWPLTKEVFGLVGSVCAAIPWIRDYGRRHRASRLDGLKGEAGIQQKLDDLRAEDQQWLSKAKRFDLIMTIGGLSLLAASFLIAIVYAPG